MVIVLGVGYALLLSKQITTIQTTSFSDRTKAKNELTASKAYATQLQTSLDAYHRNFTEADRARLLQLLPTSTDFPSILLTVQELVASADLDLQSITTTDVSVPVTSTTGTTIPPLNGKDINITVTGGKGYDQFKKFLAILETTEPIIDVTTANYTATAGDSQTGTSYTFTLRTYIMPDTTTP